MLARGGLPSTAPEVLPGGVIALVGWTNRLAVLSAWAWVVIVAWHSALKSERGRSRECATRGLCFDDHRPPSSSPNTSKPAATGIAARSSRPNVANSIDNPTWATKPATSIGARSISAHIAPGQNEMGASEPGTQQHRTN
jgi:hypothetical protein